MKKLLLPTAICLAIISITGCGEDSDGIFGISNNELEIHQFERVNNNVARIETEYSDGERDIEVTNIKGSYDSSGINTLPVSTILANDFEGTLEDQYIEVNSLTVTRPIYGKNSNERFDYKVTYRTLDLSGVDATSYQKGNRPQDDRGIFTDLNNYTEIPNGTQFPNGSVCYVPVIDSERAFFAFNNKKITGYSTLNDWVTATEDRFGSNQRVETIIPFKMVGTNNEYRTAKVRFRATSNRIEYNYYGIEFERNIFNADYIDKGKTQPSQDSLRGVIDCTLVNEVAADFLEDQIRTYVR